MELYSVDFKRFLKAVASAGVLLAGVFTLTACDPNAYDPVKVAAMARLNGVAPIANGRIALLACERSAQPIINSNGVSTSVANTGFPNQPGSIGPLNTSPVASLHVMSINTSGAYDYFYGRYNSTVSGFAGGVSGYLLNAAIQLGSRPGRVAITPDGRVAIVTYTGSNQVAFFAIAPNGAINLIRVIQDVFRKPNAIAISPDGEVAAVVNEGDSTLTLFMLTREFFDGTAVDPRIIGSNIRVSAPGLFQLRDVAFAPDQTKLLYVAASNAGVYVVNVSAALGEVPPDYFGAGVTVNARAIYSGVEDQFPVYGDSINRIAIGPTGFALAVGAGTHPLGRYGTIALETRRHSISGYNAGQRQVGDPIVDVGITANGASGLVLGRNKLYHYDLRDELVLGESRQPINIGTNNRDLALDPEGEFGLVVSDSGVHVIRTEATGLVSYNGISDTISTANGGCVGPATAAIQPRYVLQSTPATTAVTAAAQAQQQRQQGQQQQPQAAPQQPPVAGQQGTPTAAQQPPAAQQ